METEIKKDVLFNFRVERELKKTFIEHCKDNGFSISQRIRILLKRDIEDLKK